MGVSFKKRLFDFLLTAFFVVVYVQFYTLVSINLRDPDGTTLLILGVLFPLMVLVMAIVRFFKKPYRVSALLGAISKEVHTDSEENRYVSYGFSLLILSLVLYLTACALVENGYMTEAYSTFEWIACGSFSFLISTLFIYKTLKISSAKPAVKWIEVCLALLAGTGCGWLAGMGVRTLFELIFYHPHLLSW
jgi:hypothetical protein